MIRLVRAALLAAAVAALVFLARLAGPVAAGLTLAACATALLVVYGLLPGIARRAFAHGEVRRADLCYRVLRRAALAADGRAAADVSLAACRLARLDWTGALALLERVAPASLPATARPAWHNNRAYALARSGDGAAALGDIERAVALRPDAAGFRHTRGVVLLALGRVDDAIGELDSVWRRLAADPPPLLEAERCFDLGAAWERKGETAYAREYYLRSRAVAPGSRWAKLAEEKLG